MNDNPGRFYSVGVQDAVSKEWRTIRELPSVTTILKEASNMALLPWAASITISGVSKLLADGQIQPGATDDQIKFALKEAGLRHTDVRDKAGDRGTLAHDFVDSLSAFGAPEELPEDPWQAGLVKWWNQYQPKPIRREIPVANLKDGYAGRIDLLGTMNGRQGNTLVDFKTVRTGAYFKRYPSAFDSNRVQLVVYREALMQEDPSLDIKNLAVVRLADGAFHHYYVEPDTWQPAYDFFKGCLSIWKYRQIK